jgi:endonuclease/exonuclease/phosphatase (EEP) superfamily protein YafD
MGGARLTLLIVGSLALVVAVVGLISRWLTWTWQPVAVTAAFAPYLMAFGVPALLLFALSRTWWGVAVAVVVCGLAGWTQLPLVIGSVSPIGNAVTLHVLQANLKLGSADPAALVAQVRDERVDVLTTEELTAAEQDRLLAAGLGTVLPYRLTDPRPGGAGTGLWSRYPLRDPVHHSGFSFAVLSAVATVPGAGPVTVWAVHIQPPWPAPTPTWSAELGRLRGLLRDSTGPVIVGSDFNATLDHAQLRRLLGGGYRDAAEVLGAGWHPTFPRDRAFPPLLVIDHVLVHQVGVHSLRTVSLPGSDHRGLLTELTVARVS